MILNHDDTSECFVLFPTAAPMQEIYKLSENPCWVGAHMQLNIERPQADIFPIVVKLLADKALEEREEYEYIPIELLDPIGAPIPKRGEKTCCHCLGKTIIVPGNTGPSTNYVCPPAGNEKQTGCLFRLSP